MLFKNFIELVENGKTPELKKKREDILKIFESAIQAVDPYKSVKFCFSGENILLEGKCVNTSDFQNVYLIGFGKASVGMAQAVCDLINIKKGVVITNDPLKKVDNYSVETIVGGHPLPDSNSVKGCKKILNLISGCSDKDLLIFLISGGGSSLLCNPRVPLDDFQITTELLLKSSADINEINTIRKHLSFVKGGQLVKFNNCLKISLIISDVIGDPLGFIASGPTYPDSTTFYDSKNILIKYNLWEFLPLKVKQVIEDGLKGVIPETPDFMDQAFDNVYNKIIANNEVACNSVFQKAIYFGYKPFILSTSLSGEARISAVELLNLALKNDNHNFFISGGETTVKILGDGQGGRNQEMVLSIVKKISGSNLVFASFTTDGVDGNSDAAGAIADGFTLDRSCLDPDVFLDNNDSYNFFKIVNDLFFTGPTGTNVMDIQVIVK